MFIKYKFFNGPKDPGYDEYYYYELIDSEFTKTIKTENFVCCVPVSLANEYASRGLPVGRNVALFCIYCCKTNFQILKQFIINQDRLCAIHISNWAEIAKDRDKFLTKILLLQ